MLRVSDLTVVNNDLCHCHSGILKSALIVVNHVRQTASEYVTSLRRRPEGGGRSLYGCWSINNTGQSLIKVLK